MISYNLNKYDFEELQKLNEFFPDRIFDAHAHISNLPIGDFGCNTLNEYFANMKPIFGDRGIKANAIVHPISNVSREDLNATHIFLAEQLKQYEGNVGEILIFPEDSAEDIEKRLIHPNIRGLKCYHFYSKRPDTFNADVEEYLPESAWQVAQKRKLVITLHMVKDAVLSDEANLNYVKTMAKRYPDATLILAHAARAFAPWTVFGTVDELKKIENVWYDFSGVCESPAVTYILKKIGSSRCMWGSDYPISALEGKAVAIGDTFYWINENDLKSFNSNTTLRSYHVGIENLKAMKEAFILADITQKEKEDIFYNNAVKLFFR